MKKYQTEKHADNLKTLFTEHYEAAKNLSIEKLLDMLDSYGMKL